MTTTGADFTTLAAFNGSIGSGPVGDLIRDASGTFYGTTGGGGDFGKGRVFSLSNGTLTTLHHFTGDGSRPRSGVIADATGTLYGTTSGDFGQDEPGTIFSLKSDGTNFTTLATFDASNEFDVFGLYADASGTLFGMTPNGGNFGLGTIYRLKDGIFTTLVHFDGTNGAIPQSGFIADASGTLYGTTNNLGTGGNVFSLAKDGTFTTLVTFSGSEGGPIGNLLADAAGTLYGFTQSGGDAGAGTIFSITGSGFDTGAVPEPASWAMLIAGFGLTGAAMRRRRVTAVAA
jgi:uncharacterized repeat protein (TIGR03803 family)